MERPAMRCRVFGSADFMRVPRPAARMTAVACMVLPCDDGGAPLQGVAVDRFRCKVLPLCYWFNSHCGVQHAVPHLIVGSRWHAGGYRAGPCCLAEPGDGGARL